MEQGPSRGRKQCPKCENYIGVRNQNCPHCQHSFSKVVDAPKPKQETVKSSPVVASLPVKSSRDGAFDYYNSEFDTGAQNQIYVLIPSGKCPVKLDNFSKEGIKKWADDVAKHCAENKMQMSKEAIEYFAKQFCKYDSKELEKVHEVVYGL